jgi:hypothetical protein
VKFSNGSYRAWLDLPWYASKAMAKGKLEEAGLTDVVVYEDGGKTYAQGNWSGGDVDVDLPSQVKQVWKVA